MALLPGLKEEDMRKCLAEGGKILTARQLERFQIQITALSRDGRLLRGVLDQKSRFHRELMHRDKYETPYIVELPGDHSEDVEHVGYRVSLPRAKRVIALRYEEQSTSTSADTKPKAKRIRTVAQLFGEKDEFCCRTCFKRFSRKFNLERHEDGCFAKPTVYHCPICQRKYQKAPYFAAHIRKHEEEQKKRESGARRLAIEQADVEEVRRRAEQSVDRLAIPYEFGGFL